MDKCKVVTQNWASLQDAQKEQYNTFAAEDKKRYENELKQLEKKGWFKNKDGIDSRDLYKAPKKSKSADGDNEAPPVKSQKSSKS